MVFYLFEFNYFVNLVIIYVQSVEQYNQDVNFLGLIFVCKIVEVIEILKFMIFIYLVVFC